jgi:hypothetical protein
MMLKTFLRKKKNKKSRRNRNPQPKSKHRLQKVADYQPGDCLAEGTQHSSFCQSSKGVKKSEAPHMSKDSLPLSVLMLFSQKFFIIWWNRPMYTTSNT